MKRFLIFSVLIISFFGIFFINYSQGVVEKKEPIPKLYFEGSLEKLITKKDEETIRVKYQDDDMQFSGYASIKLQGSSSLKYDKKNYNIKFYEDEDLSSKLRVDLGWGAQNKYCLKANWVDKTHSRNVVTANIVSDIQRMYNLLENTPNNGEIDGYPTEVYLNNEFLGLYTLNIPKDDWMFNMDEENDNHVVFSVSNWSDSGSFYEVANYEDWEIEVGEENDENLKKLNRLINFVINSSDEKFKSHIGNYFNLDSLLNYYIMLEVAQLEDNVSKNMLLVTYDGKVWFTTLYDLDSSWGTLWNGKELLNYSKIDITTNNNLWNRLKTNFPDEIVERYFYLRGNILTEENIMNEFYSFYNSIPEDTLDKEATRWKYIPGYSLEQINEFLMIRMPLLDSYFFKMYTKNSILSRLYQQRHIY